MIGTKVMKYKMPISTLKTVASITGKDSK
jgi:hypothetical protein